LTEHAGGNHAQRTPAKAPAARGHSIVTKADAATLPKTRHDGHVTDTPPRAPFIDRLPSMAIHDVIQARDQTDACDTPTRTGNEAIECPTSADAFVFHAITFTMNGGSTGSGC